MHRSSLILISIWLGVWLSCLAVPPELEEFRRDGKLQYSTKGHVKAAGLSVTLKYPSSWKAMEGDRPHIVQKFYHGSRPSVMALLVIKEMKSQALTKEIEDAFSPEGLKSMIPDGATFHSGKTTKVDGLTAGVTEYSMRQERAGEALESHYVSFVFVFDTKFISFQGSVGAPNTTKEAQAARMAEYLPLFTLMAASIVVEDRWK